MDEVQASGEELIITKRGKPVAKLVPLKERRPSLAGFMKGTFEIKGDIIEPIDAGWEDALDHGDELNE